MNEWRMAEWMNKLRHEWMHGWMNNIYLSGQTYVINQAYEYEDQCYSYDIYRDYSRGQYEYGYYQPGGSVPNGSPSNYYTWLPRCQRWERWQALALTTLKDFCINYGDQRVFSTRNNHKSLSLFFLVHLNTYVMGLRPVYIIWYFQCGDRLQTSACDVFERQILTSKVDPRAVRVNPL